MEGGRRALARAGVGAAEAELQLELLMFAELRSVQSHGLLRLPRVLARIRNGVTNPASSGRIAWRGDALAAVDGGHGLGPVVAVAALDALLERVGRAGVAAAAIRDCDHLGALAFYADRVARQGKVLLGFTISEALVHPWGGRRAMLGTNPVTIGVPGDGDPFVVDLATSVVSMGKIHDHANRDTPIPPGWALDAAGDPTTDPHAAKLGAIAPVGEAKGYALGLGLELLVGALAGCALGPDVRGTLDATMPCNKGDLFILLEPAPGVLGAITSYLDAIRASPAMVPTEPVRIPGDRAGEAAAARRALGVTLPVAVWAAIEAFD